MPTSANCSTTAGVRRIRSGRLLLRLYGVSDEAELRRADAICTGLATRQFLAGHGSRLDQGPAVYPRRGHGPVRRGRARRSPRVAVDEGWRRLMAFEVERARELLQSGRAARARLAVAGAAGAQDGRRRRPVHPARDRPRAGRRLPASSGAAPARLGGDARRCIRPLEMQPDAYCEQKAAQSGSSFYHSFRFLPATAPARDHGAVCVLPRGRRRRRRYERCRRGPHQARVVAQRGRGDIRRRAAAPGRRRRCKQVVAGFPLREAQLQAVIDGMAMDLEQQRYLDFAELERYCDLVAGVVGLMSAEIFGYADPATRSYARDLGIAFQLTNIIRDVGEDARRGRIYLPQDELASFRRHRRGHPRRARHARVQAAAALPGGARTRHLRPGARGAAGRRPPRAAPGLIMAAIYRALLERRSSARISRARSPHQRSRRCAKPGSRGRRPGRTT